MGPCSFAGCEDFADHTCEWSNRWRISNGGCAELYCNKHAFKPEGFEKPACCADCEKAFSNDKFRIKAVIGLVVSIFVLLTIVIILFFTVLVKGSPEEEAYVAPADIDTVTPIDEIADNEVVVENVTDVRVFSESIGYALANDVNLMR